MSRLTDEYLAHLAEIGRTHSGGVTLSQENAARVFDEIRERRAADVVTAVVNGVDDGSIRRTYLTMREIEVLGEFREAFGGTHYTKQWVQALSILDRLLSQKAGG